MTLRSSTYGAKLYAANFGAISFSYVTTGEAESVTHLFGTLVDQRKFGGF